MFQGFLEHRSLIFVSPSSLIFSLTITRRCISSTSRVGWGSGFLGVSVMIQFAVSSNTRKIPVGYFNFSGNSEAKIILEEGNERQVNIGGRELYYSSLPPS